jgi:DNA-binding SARP family transcriptional activator
MELAPQKKTGQRVSITLLQSSTLRCDGHVFDRIPSAFFRIAAYLILNGPTVSRSRLADLFWADAPEDVAAANLRQTLVRIRRIQQAGNFELIRIDQRQVCLLMDPAVRCDLIELRDELQNGGEGSAVHLCRLYSGDLLADIAPAGPMFEDWLDAHRTELRNHFINRVDAALAEDHSLTPMQRYSSALHLLAIDQYNEGAYRQLMLEAATRGEAAQLHAHYARCERQLAELGVRPSAETTTFYRHLSQKQGMNG